MSVESLGVVYPPLLLLAAALVLAFAPRRIGYAIATATLIGVLGLLVVLPDGVQLSGTFLGFTDVQPVALDQFGRLVGIGLAFLGACAVMYAYSSEASPYLGAIAMIYVASAVGVSIAGDWLTVAFMWELMAISSTVLIWHYGGDAVRAGYRYAVAHGIGGSLFIFAVTWHYAETGTFVFGQGVADGGIAPGIPAFLATIGIGINVAFIGLHTWMPDSYPRPHFAASVFLAAYTTKTSALVLYRAFPEGSLFLAYMGGLMAVYGVVFALLQHDMRSLLTYHIQAQMGYITAGIGIGTAIGVAGAMGHLFNNVLYKSLLFMAIGVVIYRTGEHDLYELGGLWKTMPLTAIAFFIGALSITAVPGFNGFVSKGMILDAASGYFGGPEHTALYWLLFIGAIGTFLSFIKLGYYVFFHGGYDRSVKDAKPWQTVAMLSVGAVCIVFGIWWQAFTDLLPLVDGTVVVDIDGDLNPYSVSHLLDAGILITISLVGFYVIRKPLSRIDFRDPFVYLHPLFFHIGRVSMWVVTDAFRTIDDVVVSVVRGGYWIGRQPVTAVEYVHDRLPLSILQTDRRRPTDGGEGSRIHLRAGIGTTILLVTVTLTLILLILL